MSLVASKTLFRQRLMFRIPQPSSFLSTCASMFCVSGVAHRLHRCAPINCVRIHGRQMADRSALRHLEQQALTEFLTSGSYERHLRRMHRRNAERRTVLLDSIHRHLGDRVEITGKDAGTHIVLWPRKRTLETTVIRQAEKRGVEIYGISHCFLNYAPRPGFILGFAHLNEREIEEGIQLLHGVL
jgi:GntR family transcriptional regulator / MocR family aminotransferase